VRTGPALAAAVLAVVCAACGDDPVDVRSNSAVQADYNRDELTTAIARFVEAGRTPQAYGALAAEVAALRPGMDATVAELAELQMVVLALGPIEAARPRPLPEQTALLATTVWPVALGPAIEELAPDGWRPAREGETALRPGESADAYVRRLCDGAYAVECRHVVPEWQGAVLGAEAISRMAQRTRAAVANCEECGDAAWREAVGRWELLDRAAITERRRYEERWRGLFQEGVESGGLRTDLDGGAATLLVLSAANWAYTWLVPGRDTDELADRFTAILVDGIRGYATPA